MLLSLLTSVSSSWFRLNKLTITQDMFRISLLHLMFTIDILYFTSLALETSRIINILWHSSRSRKRRLAWFSSDMSLICSSSPLENLWWILILNISHSVWWRSRIANYFHSRELCGSWWLLFYLVFVISFIGVVLWRLSTYNFFLNWFTSFCLRFWFCPFLRVIVLLSSLPLILVPCRCSRRRFVIMDRRLSCSVLVKTLLHVFKILI